MITTTKFYALSSADSEQIASTSYVAGSNPAGYASIKTLIISKELLGFFFLGVQSLYRLKQGSPSPPGRWDL